MSSRAGKTYFPLPSLFLQLPSADACTAAPTSALAASRLCSAPRSAGVSARRGTARQLVRRGREGGSPGAVLCAGVDVSSSSRALCVGGGVHRPATRVGCPLLAPEALAQRHWPRGIAHRGTVLCAQSTVHGQPLQFCSKSAANILVASRQYARFAYIAVGRLLWGLRYHLGLGSCAPVCSSLLAFLRSSRALTSSSCTLKLDVCAHRAMTAEHHAVSA